MPKMRKMTETIQNYIKVIFMLTYEMGNEFAKTTDIANLLGVSPASVTEMIQKLSEKNIVEYTPRKGVRLKENVVDDAIVLIRRHRLAERLLTDILEMDWDNVDDIACSLEHIITSEMEKKIDEKLNYPETCPHGAPIIRSKEDLKEMQFKGQSIANIKETGRYSVVRILDESAKVLKLLKRLQILPKQQIEVLEIIPNKTILIRVNSREHALSPQLASVIIVKKE